MTQDERREYLIQYLLKEEVRFVRQSIPTDKQGQENLLRSDRKSTRLNSSHRSLSRMPSSA